MKPASLSRNNSIQMRLMAIVLKHFVLFYTRLNYTDFAKEKIKFC